MGKSIQGLVFEKILSELQTRITWENFGECRNLDAARIVGAYTPHGSQPDEQEWDEDCPMLLVSPPPRVLIGGTLNCADDVTYPFLVQIVDRDHNRMDIDRLNTWMRWQEQIRAYFSEGTLRAMDQINRVTMDQKWLDRKMFKVYKNAVFAMVVEVTARETRDAAGR